MEDFMGIVFLPLFMLILAVFCSSLENEEQNNNVGGSQIKGIKMRKVVGVVATFGLSIILAMVLAKILNK
jgi:hypothetical protein